MPNYDLNFFEAGDELNRENKQKLLEEMQVSLKTLSCIIYYSDTTDSLYFYQQAGKNCGCLGRCN